jgi:hypothetical protein
VHYFRVWQEMAVGMISNCVSKNTNKQEWFEGTQKSPISIVYISRKKSKEKKNIVNDCTAVIACKKNSQKKLQ